MNHFKFRAIPIFRILDYNKAISFYIDGLGFTLDWEHRFGRTEPVYMQLSKNGLLLHLSENERFQTGVIVFVETNGILNFYKEITANNSGNAFPPPENTPWQTLQMEIEDPFGNLLRFNETIVL